MLSFIDIIFISSTIILMVTMRNTIKTEREAARNLFEAQKSKLENTLRTEIGILRAAKQTLLERLSEAKAENEKIKAKMLSQDETLLEIVKALRKEK